MQELRNAMDMRIYKGTSLIRNSAPLGPYSRALWWSQGGGLFLMSEVPLSQELRNAMDMRIYVDCDEDTRFMRRLARSPSAVPLKLTCKHF